MYSKSIKSLKSIIEVSSQKQTKQVGGSQQSNQPDLAKSLPNRLSGTLGHENETYKNINRITAWDSYMLSCIQTFKIYSAWPRRPLQ